METVGAFGFREEPSGDPSGDPEEIVSSEGSEDAETSPPCGPAYGWEWKTSWVILHFYR